jgi:hypothetical protein
MASKLKHSLVQNFGCCLNLTLELILDDLVIITIPRLAVGKSFVFKAFDFNTHE